MTAAEILHIVWTVTWVQIAGELIAYWRTYSSEKYERTLDALSRASFQLNRCKNDAKSNAKKLERADENYSTAMANVAKLHFWHNLIMSLVFVMLFRILGAEYAGKIVAVLPFRPPKFFQRLTMRNINIDTTAFTATDSLFDPAQAGAFILIYILSNMSVKFYVQKLLGTELPEGANAMSSLMNTPLGKSTMKSLGIDPKDLKLE